MRIQGVKGLKAAAETNQLEPRRVLPEVMVAMDQRVFQGKENLIECIALLTLQSDSEALKVESIHILTQEATKGGAAYKIKVLAALLEICQNIKIDSRTQVQGKYNTVHIYSISLKLL